MGYTALYRKWRPQVFEDVVGQVHITQTIKNQIYSERIGHAYLFCGTRGTGKTSTAKIFSRAINCSNNQDGNPCNTCEICKGIISGSIMDVVEIDAASNNGVDNIREIRDEVAYSPAKGKYKVYIIDEVHMLSTGAFNALLKTLEEPPSHVLFILATTEPHKIPATILSRCQRFDFKRIMTEDIVGRLTRIIEEDHINIDKEALRLIASVSDGALRDALSILDQCMAFSKDFIKYEDVASILGVVDNSFLFEVSQAIVDKQPHVLMELIERLIRDGRDIQHFIEELMNHFRDLLICKTLDCPEKVLDTGQDHIERLRHHSKAFSQDKIIYCIKIFSETQTSAKWAANPRIILEIAMLKLCRPQLDTSPEALMDRVAELEHQLAAGVIDIAPRQVENTKADVKVSKTQQSHKKPQPKKKIVPANIDEINKVIHLWAEVINEVKKSGKVVLFGYLTDTKVEPIRDGIGVIFQNSFATNKMMVSKRENIDFLNDVIAKLSGLSVKIYCFLEKELKEDQEEVEEDKLETIIRQKDQWGNVMEVYEE